MKFKKLIITAACLLVLIASVPEAIIATGTEKDVVEIDDIQSPSEIKGGG